MDLTEDIPENSMIGRRIGAYRLDAEVGRGGMGAVYRASRVDGEFDQTVAVKLIKRGMDTDMILRRFRRECVSWIFSLRVFSMKYTKQIKKSNKKEAAFSDSLLLL